MAVVGSAQPIPNSNALTETKDGREYTAQYQVFVSEVSDGPAVARTATGLPVLGSTYSFGNDSDTGAFLEDRNPSRGSGGDRLRYIFTCTWRTPSFDSDDNKDNNGDPVDDLEDARTVGSVSFAQYNEPVTDAIWRDNSDGSTLPGRDAGQKGDVVNMALDPFIPAPEKTFGFKIIRLTRYIGVLEDFSPYLWNVNNDVFRIKTFDSFGAVINEAIGKYELFVNDIQAEEYSPKKGVIYMRTTVELWHDPQRTWRRLFLNKGLNEAPKMPGDVDLDEPGGTVSLSDWPIGKPGKAILDPRGIPIRVPVALDAKGDRADPLKPIIKMRYSIQDETALLPLINIFRAA